MAGKLYCGRRKPTQNRPVVTNRRTIRPSKPLGPSNQYQPSDLSKWDPLFVQSLSQSKCQPSEPIPKNPSFLSPVARFIVDAFRKNNSRWGPKVVAELDKLRRVTPRLVAEVLKVQTNPHLASKFFHWAGKQKRFRHDYGSYNAYALFLNRTNRHRSADQIPDMMKAQGKLPSEKQFEILIQMHASANRGLRVYYVYKKMKQFEVKPGVLLFNRVMDALMKTGHLDLALSVYEDFREAGLVEVSTTYMILIKGLCKSGRVEKMFEILERMRTNLCKPDVFAYTAMVKAMVGEGNLDGALRVWDEMRRDDVGPDVVAYGTMIVGLCKVGRVDKGFEFFREMKGSGILIDRGIYATLIEAFVVDRKVGLACDLLKDLVESGYRADLGIYRSLIRGLCDVKQVDKAYRLFRATVQEDLGPNLEIANPIFLFYAEMKRMDEFHKLLVEMERLGIPVVDSLSKFFSFVVENDERVMIAVEAFEDLKVNGYYSVEIYNILMESLHKIGKAAKALSLFDDMKNVNVNVEPDTSSYSVAIQCFVEEERFKEAWECHEKIIESSCVPSVPAYLTLARGLCTIGEIDEAMMLVRECLGSVVSGPMEFKYTLTILHVCKLGKAENVIEVLNEMMQQGCPPDDVIYSAVISGMCTYDKVEEAYKVFSNMRERKILRESKSIMYGELLVDHMKRKAADSGAPRITIFGLDSKLKQRALLFYQSKKT